MYIPVEWEWKNSEDKIELPNKQMTVYSLTREYEITKQGLRRWKKEGGRVKAYYCTKGTPLEIREAENEKDGNKKSKDAEHEKDGNKKSKDAEHEKDAAIVLY